MKILNDVLIRRWLLMLVVGSIAYAMSCTKPADITLPPHQSKLVLHGYMETGDTFRVALGKTVKGDVLVADSSTYVTNGWAVLYENDVFLDSLMYNAHERRYVSDTYVAASGKTYKIRAGAPGFTSVEAFAYAPYAFGTIKLQRIRNTRRDANGFFLDDVKFSFNDPASEKNFYWITLYASNAGSTCIYTYDPSVERYTGSLAPFDQSNCIDNDEILFNDRLFNGSLKEITISADGRALDSLVEVSGKVHWSYLKRYNISEAHYQYVKSSMSLGVLFEEGPSFSEPIVIKGNVLNGYGLFTIYAATTDTIR